MFYRRNGLMPGPAVHNIVAERLADEFRTRSDVEGNEAIADALEANGNYLRFGSQGPDFLFFNMADWPVVSRTLVESYLEVEEFFAELKAELKEMFPFVEEVGEWADRATASSHTLSTIRDVVETIAGMVPGIGVMVKTKLKLFLLDGTDVCSWFSHPIQNCESDAKAWWWSSTTGRTGRPCPISTSTATAGWRTRRGRPSRSVSTGRSPRRCTPTPTREASEMHDDSASLVADLESMRGELRARGDAKRARLEDATITDPYGKESRNSVPESFVGDPYLVVPYVGIVDDELVGDRSATGPPGIRLRVEHAGRERFETVEIEVQTASEGHDPMSVLRGRGFDVDPGETFEVFVPLRDDPADVASYRAAFAPRAGDTVAPASTLSVSGDALEDDGYTKRVTGTVANDGPDFGYAEVRGKFYDDAGRLLCTERAVSTGLPAGGAWDFDVEFVSADPAVYDRVADYSLEVGGRWWSL
jgi:hypothetical protein